MPQVLSTRALNRATLARQMLLERHERGIVESVEFLGGLQAQQSNDPYIGLWSRLEGFGVDQLTALYQRGMRLNCMLQDGEVHVMGDANEVVLRPEYRLRMKPGG